MRIEYLDEVDSTNTYIRRYLEEGEDVIVCARRQTGGRGTKGRSFCSKEGGVYLSALTFYPDLPVSRAFRIMTHSAVAVCCTAKAFGADAQIKWPNDVFAAGRKLSGTLIENILSGDKVRCSVVGIGFNVNNDVSALGGIAVSLSELVGTVKTDDVRDELISNLLREDDFAEYLSFVRFLGKEITVVEGEKSFPAIARAISEDGRLIADTAAGRRTLSAAEISVRF